MARLRSVEPATGELLAPERLVNFHLDHWGQPEEGLPVLRQRFHAARDRWSADHGIDIDKLRVVGRRGATADA